MGSTISVGHETIANIDGNTVCIDKIGLQNTVELVWEPDGAMCGDIDPPVNRIQKGRKMLRGFYEISVTDAINTAIIPNLGVTSVGGGVYNLGSADTLPTWNNYVDFGGSLHEITGCRWTKWRFSGSRGSRPIKFYGEWIGADESEGTQPLAQSALAINDIYGFTDLSAFTVDTGSGATSRANADRFVLEVDNGVVPEWGWSNTLTAASIGVRQMVFATSTPYVPDHDDMYWTVKDDEDGNAIVLTMTNSDGTLSFSSPTAVGIGALAPVSGKGDQIRCTPTFIGARSDSAGRVSPLTITLS